MIADVFDESAGSTRSLRGECDGKPLHVDQIGSLRKGVPGCSVGDECVAGRQHRVVTAGEHQTVRDVVPQRSDRGAADVVIDDDAGNIEAAVVRVQRTGCPDVDDQRQIIRSYRARAEATAVAALTFPIPVISSSYPCGTYAASDFVALTTRTLFALMCATVPPRIRWHCTRLLTSLESIHGHTA